MATSGREVGRVGESERAGERASGSVYPSSENENCIVGRPYEDRAKKPVLYSR